MSLTKDEATQLLQQAKQRKPDLTRDEAKMLLERANQRRAQSTSSNSPEELQSISGSLRSGIQSVYDFLGLGTLPRNVTTAVQGAFLGNEVNRTNNSISELQAQSSELIQRAKNEKDPKLKALYLQQSRDLDKLLSKEGQHIEQFTNQVQKDSGISDEDMKRSSTEFALRRGVAQSAELASLLLPGKLPAGASTATGRIGQAGLRGVTSGVLQGVSKASQDSESAEEALWTVLTSGAVGGVTGLAIQGVFESPQAIFNYLKTSSGRITPKLRNMYKRTLKQNVADQKFYKQYGGEDKVVEDAIKFQIPNTKSGLQREFEKYQDEFQEMVKSELAKPENATKKINLTQVRKNAEKRALKQLGSDKTLQKSAQRWFKDNQSIYRGNADLVKSNELRIGLDKTTGGQLSSEINQGQTLAKKALATELRNAFKTQVPALNEPSRKYQLMSGLVSAMKIEPQIGITEIAASAPTAVASLLTGNVPLGVTSLASPFIFNKTVRSPGFRRAVATQGIRALSGEVSKNPTSVKSVEYAVNPMIKAIQRAIDKERETNKERKRLP